MAKNPHGFIFTACKPGINNPFYLHWLQNVSGFDKDFAAESELKSLPNRECVNGPLKEPDMPVFVL